MKTQHRDPQENAIFMGNLLLPRIQAGHIYLIGDQYKPARLHKVIDNYYQKGIDMLVLRKELGRFFAGRRKGEHLNMKSGQAMQFIEENWPRALPDAPRTDAALWSDVDDGGFTRVIFDETGNLNFYGPRERVKNPGMHTGNLFAKRVPDVEGQHPMLCEIAYSFLPNETDSLIVQKSRRGVYADGSLILYHFLQMARGVIRLRIRVREDFTEPQVGKVKMKEWEIVLRLKRGAK